MCFLMLGLGLLQDAKKGKAGATQAKQQLTSVPAKAAVQARRGGLKELCPALGLGCDPMPATASDGSCSLALIFPRPATSSGNRGGFRVQTCQCSVRSSPHLWLSHKYVPIRCDIDYLEAASVCFGIHCCSLI